MGSGGRIKNSKHTRIPWRIAEVAPDFKLIDAWALPARGTLEEFADLQAVFARLTRAEGKASGPAGALFALRMWLGRHLGWDDHENELPIPGCQETSLRERLPTDLPANDGATDNGSPFRTVYATATESAAELSNSTVHAVLHLGWVPLKDGSYRGQMGVYVKPRGRLGPLYMALIAPFRHYIVYPALMRRTDRAWKARARTRDD